MHVIICVRPTPRPLDARALISFFTSDILPDDDNFGVSETCSCCLQLLH